MSTVPMFLCFVRLCAGHVQVWGAYKTAEPNKVPGSVLVTDQLTRSCVEEVCDLFECQLALREEGGGGGT